MTDHYDVKCHKLQGRIVRNIKHYADEPAWVLEIKCDSRICKGYGAGVVVLHYFSLLNGRLLETRRYRNPPVANAGNEVKAR